MNKIDLGDGYYLYYAYSMTSDESYYRVGSCNFVFSDENFKRNHRIGSYIKGNGHTYEIIDIRDGNKELFVCLKIIN